MSCSIIFFAETSSREFYSNWIIIINASIASSLAIFLVYKLKFHGLHGKTHAALAPGFSAMALCRYCLGNLSACPGNSQPMPSAADYLWLFGYGFLGYYLFMTYKEFQKKFNFGRKALVISIIGNAIFLSYIIARKFISTDEFKRYSNVCILSSLSYLGFNFDGSCDCNSC